MMIFSSVLPILRAISLVCFLSSKDGVIIAL
jgi:hypothetical protein